jgi:hypothetical protein
MTKPTPMSFSEFFDILYKKNEEIKSELEDIIITSMDELPSLNEIKNPDKRYKAYKKATDLNMKVCQLLSNAYFTKEAVSKAKYKVVKDNVTPTKLINQYKMDLESLIESIEGVILATKSFKEGVDKQLQFYNSACYMFGGILEVKSPI